MGVPPCQNLIGVTPLARTGWGYHPQLGLDGGIPLAKTGSPTPPSERDGRGVLDTRLAVCHTGGLSWFFQTFCWELWNCFCQISNQESAPHSITNVLSNLILYSILKIRVSSCILKSFYVSGIIKCWKWTAEGQVIPRACTSSVTPSNLPDATGAAPVTPLSTQGTSGKSSWQHQSPLSTQGTTGKSA